LLGFINIELDPRDGKWMMGHGYGGALHFFSCQQEDFSDDMYVEERAALSPWKAQPCLTGHFDVVTDLCWESATGDYLLTVGNDQTCRAWAPLEVLNGINHPDEKKEVWVEIARPQVHGYDLTAITSLSTIDHRHLMVTGADEKELRVFDATKTFTGLLSQLTHKEDEDESSQRVDLAFIPSLGLSNKASAAEGAEQDNSGLSESSTQLPLERDLGALSLWPETLKLYGHNTELVRLTSTTITKAGVANGLTQKDVIVASSAKARDAEAACIRLWNVSENRCLQVLKGGHRSTVTAMSFSPDSNHLVTSGKDRRLCVWSRIKNEFTLASAVDTAHKRIVWGAHFCPFDSSVFATCSRDGSIKIWKLSNTDGGGEALKEAAVFSPRSLLANGKPESVTAVAFAPEAVTTETTSIALLAVGLENGIVELWNIPLEPLSGFPAVACVLPPDLCHIASVTKLAWRPRKDSGTTQDLVLASASSDHGCRIWRVLRSP
jgi:elongator complex protein 2